MFLPSRIYKVVLSEMELGLQSFHFQSQSLQGEIKRFLSFNSLGEMIFWDVESCQTTKTVKELPKEICFYLHKCFCLFVPLFSYWVTKKKKSGGGSKNICHSSQPERNKLVFVVIIHQAMPSPTFSSHIVLPAWW